MRRKLVYLALCMPLGLLLVPGGLVLLSQPPTPPMPKSDFVDDGKSLPVEDEFSVLAEKDPVAFLENSVKRQVREIKGYSGVLRKQERIKGKENAPEVIDFWFREEPYSVLMKWREGARDGKGSLYVEGENKNKVVALSNTRIPIVWDLDPNSKRAQDAGRYSIREFSMRQGTERTLKAWKTAKEKDILKVEYLGKKPVEQLDNRVCYVLRRTCTPPEEEGVVTVELAIDAETWLQIGSTLTDGKGKLIGKYFFTSLKVNPDFGEKLFERTSLKK